jgi:hypothetical protein
MHNCPTVNIINRKIGTENMGMGVIFIVLDIVEYGLVDLKADCFMRNAVDVTMVARREW